MNKIAAIPTMYAGVQFRSRLEARWAAMFDLLHWKWDYEPIDLDGYIPDFVVKPPRDRDTLIEVKPITHWPCVAAGCVSCDPRDSDSRMLYDNAVTTIRRSGWIGPALLVGAAFSGPSMSPRLRCGSGHRIGDAVFPVDADVYPDADVMFPHRILVKCRRCPRVFLAADTANAEDWVQFNMQRWCDCDESDRAAVPFDPTSTWREAGNRVQWRSC